MSSRGRDRQRVRPHIPRAAGAARCQPRGRGQGRPAAPALLPWQPPSAPRGPREREALNGCRARRSASLIGCAARGTAHSLSLSTNQHPFSLRPPRVGEGGRRVHKQQFPRPSQSLPALLLARGSVLSSHWRAAAPECASMAGAANERRRRWTAAA